MKKLLLQKPVTDKNNHLISEITDRYKKTRCVRLLTWVSGKVWSAANPQLEDLRFSIGAQCGSLNKSITRF